MQASHSPNLLYKRIFRGLLLTRVGKQYGSCRTPSLTSEHGRVATCGTTGPISLATGALVCHGASFPGLGVAHRLSTRDAGRKTRSYARAWI